MDRVLGLSYNTEDGHYHHNPSRPLEDVTKIKLPARDKRLLDGFHMYFRKADVIETSRGCLYHCNFCSIHQMYGSSIRQFPLDRVLADIEDAYSRGTRHLFCTDDNITKIFEITGLDRVFPIHGSREEAIAALASGAAEQ